jgi:hypothetical protein
MMASDAPCILPNATHGTRGVSLGPGLVNVGPGVDEIGLVIVRIGPDVVKIKLENITMRVLSEGESLVEIDI